MTPTHPNFISLPPPTSKWKSKIRAVQHWIGILEKKCDSITTPNPQGHWWSDIQTDILVHGTVIATSALNLALENVTPRCSDHVGKQKKSAVCSPGMCLRISLSRKHFVWHIKGHTLRNKPVPNRKLKGMSIWKNLVSPWHWPSAPINVRAALPQDLPTSFDLQARSAAWGGGGHHDYQRSTHRTLVGRCAFSRTA